MLLETRGGMSSEHSGALLSGISGALPSEPRSAHGSGGRYTRRTVRASAWVSVIAGRDVVHVDSGSEYGNAVKRSPVFWWIKYGFSSLTPSVPSSAVT